MDNPVGSTQFYFRNSFDISNSLVWQCDGFPSALHVTLTMALYVFTVKQPSNLFYPGRIL